MPMYKIELSLSAALMYGMMSRNFVDPFQTEVPCWVENKRLLWECMGWK